MAIGLDPNAGAKAHTNFATASSTVSLTTTNSNDLIVVDILNVGACFTAAVSGSTLGSFGAAHANDAGVQSFRFAKLAASPLSAEVLTISGLNPTFNTVDAYAISGANTSTPFDAGGPVTANGAAPQDPLSITTVNAKTMVIGAFSTGTASPTAGAGFTLIGGANFQLTEYKILSAAQTLSVTMGTGVGTATVVILDGVVEAAAAGDTLGGPQNIIHMHHRRSLGWSPLLDNRRRVLRPDRRLWLPSNKLWIPSRKHAA